MTEQTTSIDTDNLVVRIITRRHSDYPAVIEIISVRVKTPESDKLIGCLTAWRISRAACRGSFFEVMDVTDETQQFAVTLFDKFGEVRPHLVNPGCRSGSGCWGREMNSGNLVYIIDMTVKDSYQGQGVGTWMLKQFLGSNHVQIDDTVICWPSPINSINKEVWTAARDMQVAFFRKNHFRRIGRTVFFGYSPKSDHPSRSIAFNADVGVLGDDFPNPASTNIGELQRQFPLHFAIARDKTANIATTIQAIYDKDPTSIHKADDMGITPIFMAVTLTNVIAIRKLLEWDLRSDLENSANADGVTPLERLEDIMRSEREFVETFDEWKGYSHHQLTIEYLLKQAMGQAVEEENVEEYIFKRNGFKFCPCCGHSQSGPNETV
ncbi:hypothetical protein DFH09DRAFT_1027257 [Mycena vulgaris]|nr:hypothetical protein DFH09DRAFT_1027257 [Mycena vulgaris]